LWNIFGRVSSKDFKIGGIIAKDIKTGNKVKIPVIFYDIKTGKTKKEKWSQSGKEVDELICILIIKVFFPKGC